MKVYLAGGINGLTDSMAKDWRNYVTSELALVDKNITTLDPMRRDYRGIESTNAAAIVDGDIKDIEDCDVFLAMCKTPSWGTAMEIRHAHTIGKPIIIVVGMDPSAQVSPWLAYHATRVCLDLSSAVKAAVELAP